MTNQIYIMGFISCLLTACASDNNQTRNPLEDRYEERGRISIPLTATSSSGETYRVVLPEVSLVGPDEEYTLHLQGESEFDYSLKEGEWMMVILGDWGLEKLIDDEFVPVTAEMTSSNPQFFDIYGGETTLANISFRVMDEEQPIEIEFQHGDLEIQIEIDDGSEAIECSINSPEQYQASPGELLFIDWQMEGNISEEAYVAVFSEWGMTYYLAAVTENDGTVAWTLPEDLDPNLEYHVYIEDAEDGARRTTCWDYTPLIVTAPEAEECSVEFSADDYQALPGESITIEWEMTGNISEQVYLSVSSEGGQTYYLSTIVENSGSFEWTLPEDLNPHLSYNIYIEDAEADERRTTCWRYQGLDVVVL